MGSFETKGSVGAKPLKMCKNMIADYTARGAVLTEIVYIFFYAHL